MHKTRNSVILLFALVLLLLAYSGLATRRCGELLEERELLNEQIGTLEAYARDLETQLETAAFAPEISFSSKTARQGDILSVRVQMNAPDAELPEISTDLGSPVFVSEGGGMYAAYVPVWYAQEPGEYEITVRAGAVEKTQTVTVQKTDYAEQHMTMSSATAESTVGADNADQDYADKVKATFALSDPERYWEGTFLQPVQGRISTEFGLYRYTQYTDGGNKLSRHTGIDIAVAEGTPVPASNAGKVVFAGNVIITGNTVVIEHGGGLKTYYYHLSEIDVSEGDTVRQGDIIGKVGSTGYSTGAHLHFEVKIGQYSVSPWPLFDGSSDLYE